jgi:hypothetical protein
MRHPREKSVFCTHCGKQVSEADQYCVFCGSPLHPQAKPSIGGQRKSIPDAWVEEKTKLLKERLPKDVQESPFYPDDLFYLQYYADPLASLHYKAQVIFSLLNIEPCGCVIDFCEEKQFKGHFSADTAGLYTTIKDEDGQEREVILINSKHKDNTLAVGAILAHEMMHLYLSRLNLRLQDTQENELLTDLATINAGLSILILNGMSYSSDMWLTIIMAVVGRVYWREQEVSFGYYRPDEYGRHSLSYFSDRSIPVNDFIGYLSPTSRRFVPHGPFVFVPHGAFVKGRPSTAFIQVLERKQRKSIVINGGIAAAVLVPLLVWGILSEKKKHDLQEQIQACKAEVLLLESKINGDTTNLKHLDEEIAKYKNSEDIDRYNGLVDPYNSLLTEVKEEISQYEAKRAACNGLIDQYNRRR